MKTAERTAFVIHLMPHPGAALRFVAPLVSDLVARGVTAELWVERVEGLQDFYDAIPCDKRTATFNLTLRPWTMLAGGIRLLRDLRQRRPTIIQAHTSRGALIPLLAACWARVPVRIYHNHGVPYAGYRGPLRLALYGLERLNVLLATHVLTVSPAMQGLLQCAGARGPKSCAVISPGSACGIDLAEFKLCSDHEQKPSFKSELKIPVSDFVVLYVGRAHVRKGFHDMLRVWQRHFAGIRNARLILAGCDVRDVRKVLGEDLPTNIWALGYVEDLRPYYAAADVVALPSYHEGFGYALLEGAASACVLLASKIPGPDTIVRDGINGFLVEAGDQAELADRLRRLSGDPVLRARMGAAAHKEAGKYDRLKFLKAYRSYMMQLQPDLYCASRVA